MGTYVYSLRKKHVEAKLDGIYSIDVIAYQYAYKESYAGPGDYGYADIQRLAGRTSSMAEKASDYYKQRALEEHGEGDNKFYYAMGGLDDGAIVYRTTNWLPTAHYDSAEPLPPSRVIGRLFKIGRGDWVVSESCPKHVWEEYSDGTTFYQCQRCDTVKKGALL